jgi:hypothetical protein
VRRRRGALIGIVAVGAALLPGCVDPQDLVVIAGRDTSGTVVVGAYECADGDRGGPLSPLSVRAAHTAPTGGEDILIWQVWSTPTAQPADRPGDGAPDPPPRPRPTHIGPVALISVGAVDVPRGGTITTALDRGLPPTVVVRAQETPEDEDSALDAPVDTDGPHDRYTVTTGSGGWDAEARRDLTAVEATTVVEDFCDDDGIDVGRVLAVLLIGGAAVAFVSLAAVGVGLWQYKRAGAAEARRGGA